MARFFLSITPVATLQSWLTGLRNLTFTDNFRGYEWEGEIDASTEKKVQHTLKVIPTRFIVISARGTVSIVRAETPPTVEFIHFKNIDAVNNFKGKILILP